MAGNGKKAGDADDSFGDALLDVLGIVLLVTNEPSEISRAGDDLEPVEVKACSRAFDQHGLHH